MKKVLDNLSSWRYCIKKRLNTTNAAAATVTAQRKITDDFTA